MQKTKAAQDRIRRVRQPVPLLGEADLVTKRGLVKQLGTYPSNAAFLARVNTFMR